MATNPIGPGLLGMGGNLLLDRLIKQRAEGDLRKAQGPHFNTMQNMAGQSLALAGSMDPNAMAAERFKQQQALLEPGRQLQEQQLMRLLQKRGMLGAASFAPVPGAVTTPGTAVQPHLAALYAAQEGAKSQSAYDSLREGQAHLDQLLNRSGMLQRSAEAARATGQVARSAVPSSPSITETLVRGGVNILKDPKARTAMWEGIQKLPGMISGMFSSAPSVPTMPSAYNYDFDGWSY